MKSILRNLLLAPALLMMPGCSDDEGASPIDEQLNSQILAEFSGNVAQSAYDDLAGNTSALYTHVLAFASSTSETNLLACRNAWYSSRNSWEQTEAWLFGPVSTENIDPRIDTWPVNFNDLEAQLATSNEFTESYINNLEDALKGFHPIEYLLFGEDGEKAASDFTERELDYLKGLALNLNALTTELADGWDDSDNSSYYHEFSNAGNSSTVYESQLAAFEEMVNAMSGICDEVANGKISEPFLAADPTLEESPFSGNSITDFTNNIKGVQNVYLGKYTSDGKGLEDLVRKHNLQLDGQLKEKIASAISALGNVTDPFGEAITSQPIQVQNAIDAINSLKDGLEEELLPFIQQHAK
jgi:predicted lipoprotein